MSCDLRQIRAFDSSGVTWVTLGEIQALDKCFPFYFGRVDPRPLGTSSTQRYHRIHFILPYNNTNLYVKLFEQPVFSLYIEIWRHNDNQRVFRSQGHPNEESNTRLENDYYELRVVKDPGAPTLPDGTANYDLALHAYPNPWPDHAGTTPASAYAVGDLTFGRAFHHADFLYCRFGRDRGTFLPTAPVIHDLTAHYRFNVTRAGSLRAELRHIDGIVATLHGPGNPVVLSPVSDLRLAPGEYVIELRKDFIVELPEYYRIYELYLQFAQE